MYYFFYDNKTGKGFKKATKLFADLKDKKPDATFVSYDATTINLNIIEEITASQGLFETKIVCYFSNISQNAEIASSLKKILGSLKESQTICIIVESSLKKAELELFEKMADKSDIQVEQKEKKDEINVFAIADAFGSRDKKKFWSLLFTLKKEEVAAEEVHGILWWQLKSMILALGANSTTESGLKPFVYTKSKNFTKKFSSQELQDLADKFISIYHEAHRGEVDLYEELEKVALRI